MIINPEKIVFENKNDAQMSDSGILKLIIWNETG